MISRVAVLAAVVLWGCGGQRLPAPDGGTPGPGSSAADAGAREARDGPLDTVVEVPVAGPYGRRTFTVHAASNWVNSGLYLRAGEWADLSAAGAWTVDGATAGPGGLSARGLQRGCARGALAARSGLRFEGEITCVGEGTRYVAPRDGTVYLGMIDSTDLGEAYGDRLVLGGALQVTVDSAGDTVPALRPEEVETYPFGQVASGEVELLGRRVAVSISTAQAVVDGVTARASLETLDALYERHAALRGMVPFGGQRIRFYPDDTIGQVGYMVAGNPIRCVPELMSGQPWQRILRASVPETDVWGFAHELGHVFSFANGAWVFQVVNLESWPNVFTLHALQGLGRTAHQPNLGSYCNGREAYLAGGSYAPGLRDDPFLQLCFLMEFQAQHGWVFWERFWSGMNTQSNGDVGYDGNDVDRSVWSYVRDRFSEAAGQDVTPVFQQWRVPVR
ncbi:MAG: hypothetical protein FJ086_10645 [Deltaproteobacteria bacterium]|nr:hypothetical protein [Deltaproteobacteria bacterium]